MDEQTQFIQKPMDNNHHTSSIGGISMRGWITLIVMVTVCYMSIMKILIAEPLYTMATMVVAFYFGQNKQPPKQTTPVDQAKQ